MIPILLATVAAEAALFAIGRFRAQIARPSRRRARIAEAQRAAAFERYQRAFA